MQNKEIYERAKLTVTAFENSGISTDDLYSSNNWSFNKTASKGLNSVLILADLWTPPHDLNGTR